MTNEISSVTIPVNDHVTGAAAQQQAVCFRIFRQDDWFKAIPVLSGEERRLRKLPEELVFICLHHAVVAANHMEEETLAVIRQIITELEVQELL